MKEFEASAAFVSEVMKKVRACETERSAYRSLAEIIVESRPFRYVMSGGGIVLGVVLAPVVCH